MHSESGNDDGDDDEPVREQKDEMTVTGTHHRQVCEVLWEVH